jgi:DNA-damage-inducible protein D
LAPDTEDAETRSDRLLLRRWRLSLAELVPYFDGNGEAFEQKGVSNGGRYWYARDFMEMLGYESFQAFEQAINKAIGTCTTLGIPVIDNFEQSRREVGGELVSDYKLTRFGCYLVAMNGDVRKAQVAQAQAYFAGLAEATRQYIESVQDVERVQIRDDISERERSLGGVAKAAGVTEYHFFQNAGYRGMYNLDLSRLKEMKGLGDKGRSLLDFMGRRELAANLFRLTETEAKLKGDGIRGQKPAEMVAYRVGQKVRDMMMETDGTRPEMLPLAGDIKGVKKGLKQTHREFKQLDKPRKKR